MVLRLTRFHFVSHFLAATTNVAGFGPSVYLPIQLVASKRYMCSLLALVVEQVREQLGNSSIKKLLRIHGEGKIWEEEKV